jgi:hypothetical protein
VKLTTHLHLVARSKNERSYTSTPQYAFMEWCSVKAQGQLYLLPLIHKNNMEIVVRVIQDNGLEINL